MNFNNYFQTRVGRGCLALAAVMVAAQKNACGQEAMRIATQADQAATVAAQQREGTSEGNYDFLLGPTAWQLSSGLGLQYNDNVYAVSQGTEGSFILAPSVGTQMHWPVTLNNSLDISLNGGYSEYLEHSDLSRFFITSGSGLNFDVFVGECKINLHDQISISQFNYQNPGVSGGSGNYNSGTLQNTAGIGVTRNFGMLIGTVGFDHVNYLSVGGGSIPVTDSENFTGTVGMPIREGITVGLEAGGSLIDYGAGSVTPDTYVSGATQWSTGVFGSAHISDHISVQVHGGYSDYIPDEQAPGQGSGDDPGFYFSVSLNHQVNQWLSYQLTAGRSTDLSSSGLVQNRTYVNFGPSCSLFNHYTVSMPFTYQQGTQPGFTPSQGAPEYDEFIIGLMVSRPITKKLTGSFSYQYIEQDSGATSQGSNTEYLAYKQNIISLNFNYQF